MRETKITRTTTETDIELALRLDGDGEYEICTGCGFLDHMLTLFACHGGFDLSVRCDGDSDVDFHHTTEDIGIVLGRAFSDALGDRKGIRRYGDIILPMDEALILAAIDISGRGILACELDIPTQKVGDFDTELTEEFLSAFSRTLGATLHIRQLAGRNSHHIIEGVFKALARVLREACEISGDKIMSTKGSIKE